MTKNQNLKRFENWNLGIVIFLSAIFLAGCFRKSA